MYFFFTDALKFKSQLSPPTNFFCDSRRNNYRRSASDPVDTQKKVSRCEKNPSNKAWKIFDKYYDQVINVLRKDANLCDSMLELLADKFLIESAERDVIQQLSNLDIRSRAMMGHVSTFISRSRHPIKAFAKFVSVIQNFEKFNQIFDKMNIEGNMLPMHRCYFIILLFVASDVEIFIRSTKAIKLPTVDVTVSSGKF